MSNQEQPTDNQQPPTDSSELLTMEQIQHRLFILSDHLAHLSAAFNSLLKHQGYTVNIGTDPKTRLSTTHVVKPILHRAGR